MCTLKPTPYIVYVDTTYTSMIAWIIGLAVVSLALVAWQLGWFKPAQDETETEDRDKSSYQGKEGVYGGAAVRAARRRPTGDTEAEAKSDSQDESKSQGTSRNNGSGVVGAAVHTGCTPSASSDKNIIANQCRGRGARYDLFDDMGTKRNLTSDPQKQGILASNVAPRAKHADEQLYDYDRLHARLHGPRQVVQKLYYGNNGVTPQKVAAALQNELTAINPAALDFAGIQY